MEHLSTLLEHWKGFVQNSSFIIQWLMAHQPAIIIVDIKQKKDTVIDVAIPSDSNIRQKEHLKYINLKIL